MDNETDTIENDLTQKFLRGELSFAEYSNEWFGKDDDDNDEISLDDQKSENNLSQSDGSTSSSVRLKRRSKYRLSVALVGLMGEANIRFVRGEKDVAEKMCYEIIRQVPTAPEPYQTLAQIYEDDPEKSLQFSLLAAHLCPCDAQEWLRLAEISKQKNDVRQEMLCYTQAIKSEPHNFDIHLKRLNLVSSLENSSYRLHTLNISKVKCYRKIVTSLPASNGENILKYAKMAAKCYHDEGEIEQALEMIVIAYKKCSDLFTLEDVNLFLELLIAKKQYKTCIEVLIAKAEIEIEAEIQTMSSADGEIEEQTNFIDCKIPSDLPIDLRSKLLVCFVYLKAFDLVKKLLHDFLSNDIQRAGDLFMDIEEALSHVGQHELALQVLQPLVTTNSFDLGAVWLKHAECLYNLGNLDEAVNSYYKVLQHAPQHKRAKEMVYTILVQQNRLDDALKMLKQDYSLVVNAELLYKYCCELKKYNRLAEYLEAGEALLSKTFMRYRNVEELRFGRLTRSKQECLYSFRLNRGEPLLNDDDIHFDESETFSFSVEQEWNLFLDLYKLAFKFKKYYVMERLSFGALMSKTLNGNNSYHLLDIEFYCVQSCILNNDCINAIFYVKDFVAKFRNRAALNVLNYVTHYNDFSLTKYISRQFTKQKLGDIVELFMGNKYLTNGRCLQALKHYLEFNKSNNDPLTYLLIAVCLFTAGSMRNIVKHHSLILQAVAYLLKYKHLRKCDQEVYYNFGRAYQSLSLNNLAIEYYEKALACPPPAKCMKHGDLDLTKYIAYNLMVLYQDHSPVMAQQIMFKYLVI